MNEVAAIKDKKQIDKVKAVLRKYSFRDYMLFVMGINTGLRISDLLNLTFKDVLGDTVVVTDTIKVKEKKTGKTKTFFVNETVKKCLLEYMKDVDVESMGYLFASRKGDNKPITRIQAYRIINDACGIAKIKGSIGTHTLRKTFGYWAYKQGIDITLFMKIFNHSAPSITLRYIGITQEDINNVYVNLNL
ncbi:MAG: site-specific integrase [Desulfitobacteriaceae bacterium]